MFILLLLFLLPSTAAAGELGKFFTFKGDQMLDMCYECGECIRLDGDDRDECLEECVIKMLLAIITPVCKQLCGGDTVCTKLCTRVECVKCALEPSDKIKTCLIRCLGKPLCDIVLEPPCRTLISSWVPRVRTEECVDIGCGCLDCFIDSGDDEGDSNCWLQYCIGDLILGEVCENILSCEIPCRSDELAFRACKGCTGCLLLLIPGSGDGDDSRKSRMKNFEKCLYSKCLCLSIAGPILGEVCEEALVGIFRSVPGTSADLGRRHPVPHAYKRRHYQSTLLDPGTRVQVEYHCNSLIEKCCDCITVEGEQEQVNCFMTCGLRALIIGPMCAAICSGSDALINKHTDKDLNSAVCFKVCNKCGDCVNKGFYYDVKRKKFVWDGKKILNCTIECILKFQVCPLIAKGIMCKDGEADKESFLGLSVEDYYLFIWENVPDGSKEETKRLKDFLEGEFVEEWIQTPKSIKKVGDTITLTSSSGEWIKLTLSTGGNSVTIKSSHDGGGEPGKVCDVGKVEDADKECDEEADRRLRTLSVAIRDGKHLVHPGTCAARAKFFCENCLYCVLAKPAGGENYGEAVGKCLLKNCLINSVCHAACSADFVQTFGNENLFAEHGIGKPTCDPNIRKQVCLDLCRNCAYCFLMGDDERTKCLQKCAFELGCKIACSTSIGCSYDALANKTESLVQTVLPATKNPCTGRSDGDSCSKEGVCYKGKCMKRASYDYQECSGKYHYTRNTPCDKDSTGDICRTADGKEGLCVLKFGVSTDKPVDADFVCKVLSEKDCGEPATNNVACTTADGLTGVCKEHDDKWTCEVTGGASGGCNGGKGKCLNIPSDPSECKGEDPPEYCRKMFRPFTQVTFGGGLACIRAAKTTPCKGKDDGSKCSFKHGAGTKSGFCYSGQCYVGSDGCKYDETDPKTKKKTKKDAPDGYLGGRSGHVCYKKKALELSGNGREECAESTREDRVRKVWCSAGNGICVYPGGRPPACIEHTMKTPATCKAEGSDGKVCFDDLTTRRGICESGECLVMLVPDCADYSNNLKIKSCYDVCDTCLTCYDKDDKDARDNCLKGCWNPLEVPCLSVCQDTLGLSGTELNRCAATCIVCQGCPYGCNPGNMKEGEMIECITGCLFHKSGVIISNICEELAANVGISEEACLACTKCYWAGGARDVRRCLVERECIPRLDICMASCPWVCQGETSGECFDSCCACEDCLFKDTLKSRNRCFLDCVCPPLITSLCDQVCEGREGQSYESCKEVCLGCGMCCRRPAGGRLECLGGCIEAQALYIECDAFCSGFPNPLMCITCCRSNVQCAVKKGEDLKQCLLEGTKDCVNGLLFDVCEELCGGEPGCMEVCQKCTMCPLTSPDLKECVARCIDDLAAEITAGICDAVCFSAYDKAACMDDCEGCKGKCAFIEDVAARLECFEDCDDSGSSKLEAILTLYGIRMACTALFAPGGVAGQLTGAGGSWGQMGAELAGEAVCMGFCLSGIACDVKFMKHFIACPERANPNLYIYYNSAAKYYENAITFYDNIERNLVVLEVAMAVQTGFCVYAQGKELVKHGIMDRCYFGIALYAPYPPMAGSVWWNSCTVCWISSLGAMFIPATEGTQCDINRYFSSPIGIPWQLPTWNVAKKCGKRTGIVDDICSVDPGLFRIGQTHDPMTWAFKVNQLRAYTHEMVKDGGILKTALLWVKKLRDKARECTVAGSCDNDIRPELEGLKAAWQAAESVNVGKGGISGGDESWSLEDYEEELDEMSMWTKSFYSDASRSSSTEMFINRACSWNKFKEDDISPDYEKYIWRYGIITRCALYNLKTSAPGDFMWHDTDCLLYTAASDALGDSGLEPGEEELPVEGDEEIDEECEGVRDGRQCMFGICCDEACEMAASCCELRENDEQCNTISGKHGICCEGWCVADQDSCDEVVDEEEVCIDDGDECSDGGGLCCDGNCFIGREACEEEEVEACVGNDGVACDEGRGLCCDGSCVYGLEECPEGEVPPDDLCSPICLEEHGTDGYCQPSRKRCACRTGLFPIVLEDARCETAMTESTIARLEDYCAEQGSGEVDECHTASSSSGYCCQGVLEEAPIGNDVVVSKRPRPSITALEWIDADGEPVRVAKVGDILTLRVELTDRLDPLSNAELQLTVRTSTRIVLSRTIPDITMSPDTRREVSIDVEVTAAMQNEVLLADAVLLFAGHRVESEVRPRIFVPEPNTIQVMDAAFFINDLRSTEAYPGDSVEALLVIVSSYSEPKEVSVSAHLAEYQGADISGTWNNDYPTLMPYEPVTISTGMLGSIGTYLAGGAINVIVLIKDRGDLSLVFAELVLDTERFPELALEVNNPYLTLIGIDFADSSGRMTESVFDGEDVTVRVKLRNDMGTIFQGNIEMVVRDTDLTTVHREVFTTVELMHEQDTTLRSTFEARALRTSQEVDGGVSLILEPNDHVVELNAIDVNGAEWLDTVARTWRLRTSPGDGGDERVRILSTTRYDQCHLAIECEGCNPECSIEIQPGCTAVFNLCTCESCMFKPLG